MQATLNGATFYYFKYGRRTAAQQLPIVLLHGGPGLDHSYLRPWLDSLGDAGELIYMDALGSGRSQGRELLGGATLASAAADLEALRQHLQLEKFILLGHGYGGFVAQTYALTYAAQVAGLILCASAPALDYPQVLMHNAQAAGNAAQLQAVVGLLSAPLTDDAQLRQLYCQALPIYFYRYDPKIGAAMTDGMRFCAAAYNRGLFDLLPALQLEPQLRDLRCPSLILGGRHDWLMPPAQAAERLHAGIAGSALALFEESGHFPFVEEPVAFFKVVRSWLRSHQLRA